MSGSRSSISTLALLLAGCSGVDATRLLEDAEPGARGSLPEAPPLNPPLAADALGCHIEGLWPAFGARDVPITVEPELYFSVAADPERVRAAIRFVRLDDGRDVPFEAQAIAETSFRITPRQPLAFWQSYSLTVSSAELACEGVLGTFSTPAPELVPPPLRTAAALDLARHGNVVYSTAPSFHGLQVHRIEGSELRLVGQLHWPAASHGVRLFGERAYVPAGEGGVVILDISTPEAPRVLGSAGVPGGASDVVAFRSGERELLAAAAGSEGVVLLDVSDPERSRVVSRFDISGSRRNATLDVDLDATRLAVADGANGLFSLDLSQPEVPLLLGRSADASAERVRIAGDHLFVLFAGWPRIRSYASAQPGAALAEWSSCGLPCGLFSSGFDLLGDTLYAATRQGGVLRVSAGAGGSLSGSSQAPLRLRSAVQSVLAQPDLTLVGEVGGLALFLPDGSGPYGFDPNGHGDASGVAVRGKYAYVAASFAGLQTFDISDPLRPRWVGRVDSPGMTSAHDLAATRVTVAGDVLLLSDGRAGLSVYSLTDPERPALAASFSDGIDRVQDVVVVDGGAYCCNDNGGIERIDIAAGGVATRSTALRFEPGEGHQCLALARHPLEPLVYVGDTGRLGIYARGPSGELRHQSDYVLPFGGNVGTLAFSGTRLIATTRVVDFAAGSPNGASTRLHVLDVSDARAPRELWHSEPQEPISSLALADQTLLVGGGTKLRIYDLSTPEPELQGSVRTESVIRHLAVTADAVYVAQSTGGLGVLRTGPLPPRFRQSGIATPAALR